MASSLEKFEAGLLEDEGFEAWLREQIMVDEWGRPPGLADVPMTIMTREKAFNKQNIYDKKIMKQQYQEGEEE